MKLNRGLAKKIVANTMQVLGKNINIMNHNGIIIGSGDRERINDYHEVAAKVIKEEKSYIIREEESGQFQGVKEGINLPIKFQEKIVGVVGITGKYDEVADYGQLVKSMVELLLQQEFLRREIEIENKARETFYQQVISNSIESQELLEDRANLLDIATEVPRVVILIKIKPYDSKDINNEMKRIENMYFVEDSDILFIRGENIVWTKNLDNFNNKTRIQKLIKYSEEIVGRLKESSYNPTIAIGQIFEKLEDLHLSYKGAKQVLKVTEKIFNGEKNIYCLNRLGVDYFISFLPDHSIEYYLQHLFDRNIEKIFAEKKYGNILKEFVDNDMNVSQTAQAINVHRNTLLYKLDKIHSTTGLNPKDTRDLFALYWAYHLFLYSRDT